MASPSDRRYTQTHEWVKPDPDNSGYYKIGITAYRANQLGTISGQNFHKSNGGTVAATDNVCTVSGSSSNNDTHAAMRGVLRNEKLLDSPSTIGTDPWNTDLFSVQATDSNDYNSLMTAAQYDAFTS